MPMYPRTLLIVLFPLFLVGCGQKNNAGGSDADAPVFSLAWSEYPSWSVFGVAHEKGLIDKEKGKMGSVEEKWGVDIELKEADYDTCLTLFASGQCDAACLTNMDSLAPAMGRTAVGILPTSTSFGADALIVEKSITDVKQLKGKKVFGLEATVSEYTFARNLELLGEDENDYDFSNMDPGAAAMAMQQKQDKYDAIVVWNPFVLETLKKRDDVTVLFDSTKIPGEIVDMVTMASDAIDKPGGPAFAHAVIDAFYQVSAMIEDPATRDSTLVALGEKFSSLELEAMKKVVEQTKFYKTPAEGIALFEGAGLKETMTKVAGFCVKNGIIDKQPGLAFGSDPDGKSDLLFDASYMKAVQAKN